MLPPDDWWCWGYFWASQPTPTHSRWVSLWSPQDCRSGREAVSLSSPEQRGHYSFFLRDMSLTWSCKEDFCAIAECSSFSIMPQKMWWKFVEFHQFSSSESIKVSPAPTRAFLEVVARIAWNSAIKASSSSLHVAAEKVIMNMWLLKRHCDFQTIVISASVMFCPNCTDLIG